MRVILAVILSLFVSSVSAQVITQKDLAKEFNQGNYKEVISMYPKLQGKNFTSGTLYLVGLAYYKTEDYDNAATYINQAINQDKTPSADMFYHRGMCYYYLNSPINAKQDLTKAIILEPSSFYYKEKALIYYNTNEPDTAILLLNTATALKNPDYQAFYLRGVVYADMGLLDEALYAYAITLEKVPDSNTYFLQTLYDIGVIEQFRENYKESNDALLRLVKKAPTDYYSIQEIVQNYHALGMHDKAAEYKVLLYEGYNNKILPPDLRQFYCFETYTYNGYNISAYENFPGEGSLESFEGFSKQIYNVYDTLTREILFSIETKVIPQEDYSVNIQPVFKYVLIKRVYLDDENEEVIYYWEYLYKDRFTYEALKKGVNYILDGNKPGLGFKPYWFDKEVEVTN